MYDIERVPRDSRDSTISMDNIDVVCYRWLLVIGYIADLQRVPSHRESRDRAMSINDNVLYVINEC